MIEFSWDASRIDWERAAVVFQRAPLGRQRREPEKLKRAFAASFAAIFAFHDQELIGMSRALCDGEYQAAIYDMVLLPEFQGRGIGKEMLTRLCAMLPVENIILYVVPGREGFYDKCGFKIMRTAMAKLNQFMAAPESGYLSA
ncbi:MAG: GNAT family N-acetyltransferase [Pseudomonadota bacterium]